MSSCSFCSVICSRASESLWTQKFFKPGGVSDGKANQRELCSFMRRPKSWLPVPFGLHHTRTLPPQPLQTLPDGCLLLLLVLKHRCLNGIPSSVAFSWRGRYLQRVLGEGHQAVLAPLARQTVLRLPALHNRQTLLDLRVRPCRD